MPAKTYKVRVVGIALAGILLMLQAPRRAMAQDDDPPSRVARMNYAQGSVSFQPGGEGDWVTAVPNRPLTTGDNLWTDRDSRAELHIGSTAIRMRSETSLTFLDLDDRNVQLRLSQGSIILQVRHLDDGDVFEVDTPNAAFSVLRTGEYRVDVNENGDQTFIAAFRGRGEVTGGGYSYTVVGGQRARFFGTDQLNYDIADLPRSDDFDDWAFDRDRREDRAESANYVSQEMTGYEDLDDYGRWRYVAGYGPVWAPVGVPVGWAPYRFGHWVFVRPWGWTWVDDEPWGFAPFHYGRWAYVDSGWCWVPGPVFVRPVYAPALVVFVGGGDFDRDDRRFGGGPGVAWFPLAPGEVYVPGYRASRTYVNNVNVTNTVVNVTKVTNVYNTYVTNKSTNVTQITYVNQRVPNGVTAVPRETFVNARPVAKNVVPVDPKQIAQAPVTHVAPVQPVKASVLGAGAPAKMPPASVVSRPVIAKRSPAPPPPPFEQKQSSTNARPSAPANVRPVEPAPRQPEVARPQEAPRMQEPAGTPRPQEAPSPPEARETPRPSQPVRPQEPTRPQEPIRPQETVRPQPLAQASRPQETWSHPLAKPAPPVQEKSPAQMREEENKSRNWQEQHQKSAPPAQRNRPQPPPQQRPQEQRQPEKRQPEKRQPDQQENRPPGPPGQN